MPKLTKRTIDALTTDRAEAFAWDTIVLGFGVRVRKGGSKTFILKYRMGSAVRRHSLGKVGSPYTPSTRPARRPPNCCARCAMATTR